MGGTDYKDVCTKELALLANSGWTLKEDYVMDFEGMTSRTMENNDYSLSVAVRRKTAITRFRSFSSKARNQVRYKMNDRRALEAMVRESLHQENHKGNRLSDIILGGQDGLVNVLGVLLGVAAASQETRIVIAADWRRLLPSRFPWRRLLIPQNCPNTNII